MFRAGSQVKRSTVVLKALPGGAIEAGATKRWENEELSIPEDAVPASVGILKAIQIKYTLSVSAWLHYFVLEMLSSYLCSIWLNA